MQQVHTYGLPSFFLTMSPDDTNSKLVLRFSTHQTGEEETHTIDLPTSFVEKQKLLAANPVAAAVMFKQLQEHVFEKLIGLPLSHKSKKSGVPWSHRQPGVCGEVIDFFSVTEIQGRGYVRWSSSSCPPSPQKLIFQMSCLQVASLSRYYLGWASTNHVAGGRRGS